MYRVLHVMAGVDAGGISTVVLNYYRYINKEKVHFDIAITSDNVGQNGEKLKKLGSQIYFLPLKSQGLVAYETALKELLRKEKFDAIHVHENETSYIALRVAKHVGIKCRIAHSHTTSPYVSIKSELRRLSGCILNYHYATKVIGCGQLAGERVFGKINMRRSKAMILPNAIEVDKFKYSAEVRNRVRTELNVEDKFVIGMVGRLSAQKNYLYALKVIFELYQRYSNIVFVIAGNGSDESLIRDYINENKMGRYVKVLGRRNDVEALYQAFDVFMLTSKYEGFPVSAVEAMASGLPILLSDTITKELSFGESVYYLPLNNIEPWVTTLMSVVEDDRREYRQNEIKKNNFDIKNAAHILEDVYLA